jgi:prepilin-type processing-associated H-X9-DG protein
MKNKRGFTLIELLVVIARLALQGSVNVGFYDGHLCPGFGT